MIEVAGEVGDGFINHGFTTHLGTVGDVASVGEQLRERWGGFASRITLTVPSGSDPTVLSDLVDELSETRAPTSLIAGERV
jgi:hypothetical protein